MNRHRWHTASLLVLVAALTACNGLTWKEAGYRNNVKEYDALLEKATPALEASVEAKRKAHQDAYDALPTSEAEREEALHLLNERADAELDELEAEVEAANLANAAEKDKAMAAYQARFVGTWEGDGVRLRIDEQGGVNYTSKSGSVDKSLTGASVTEFRRDAFDAGLLGISTTFEIDEEPTEDRGVWTMTLDGAKLTRVAGPSGEPEVGTFTCRVLVNERCVDRTDHFPQDAPVIQMSYRSKDVPKANSEYAVQWIAEIADADPADKVIAVANTALEVSSSEPIDHVSLWSNMEKPEAGWPQGKYRVEVSRGGEVLATAKFVVDPPAKP